MDFNYSLFEVVDRAGEIIPMALTVVDDDLLASPDETILNITVPAEAFSVTSSGLTSTGTPFKRLSPSVYVPQTIKVSFNESSRPTYIPEGNDTVVKFIVENFGSESATVDILVSDDKSYLNGFDPSRVTLLPDSSETVNAILSAPEACNKTVIVRVTATATIVGETLGNLDIVNIADACKEIIDPVSRPLKSSKSPKSTKAPKSTKSPKRETIPKDLDGSD